MNVKDYSSKCENVNLIGNVPSDKHEVKISLSREDLKANFARDKSLLNSFSENIVSGYLNLGKDDGWKEGSDPRIGCAFARYILARYYLEERQNLGANEQTLVKVINAFSDIGDNKLPIKQSQKSGFYPKDSRVCYDSSVDGWDGHAITRLVGNLGSTYNPLKPSFEVLVNSARTNKDEAKSKPFQITIFKNEQEIEDRRKSLAALAKTPLLSAYYSFYPSNHTTAGSYLKENQKHLGPISTRLLQGLEFLENTTLPTQKVGNCWIKQPMRGLLSSIFIETLTERTELSVSDAWKESTSLYKGIQKIAAIPFAQDLMQLTPMTPTMKISALRGIEKQKNL